MSKEPTDVTRRKSALSELEVTPRSNPPKTQQKNRENLHRSHILITQQMLSINNSLSYLSARSASS